MAAFQLSLNQVNFEGDTFEQSDHLDSFSNLYCYDSDFKADDIKGTPVTTKQVQNSGMLCSVVSKPTKLQYVLILCHFI